MKFFILNILLLTYSLITYSQKRPDSTMIFLKNLNKRIVTLQKQNDYVKYDFKFSDLDTAGNKKNILTGTVSISKLKNGTKYFIKYNEEDKIILSSNKGLLITNNKEKTYSKLDSADKKIFSVRYRNMMGLLDEFRLNTGVSFVNYDSSFYGGIIKENKKDLYFIQHIYNPRIIDMKETFFIDTFTLFTVKKIYTYKIDTGGYYGTNILEIQNITFDRTDIDFFDELIYTKGKTEIQHELPNNDTLTQNSEAPVIAGIDINTNKQFDELTIKNKPVILDFWFIECYPCAKAHKILEQIQLKYQGKELQIIGANNKDDIDKIRIHLNKTKNNHLNLKVSAEFIKNFKVGLYPTIVCIDKAGRIKYIANGFEADLEKKLEDFVLSEINK